MTDAPPEWWATAIADFGASLGFADADGWRQDVLNLSLDNGKYLIDVERSGDDIVLAVFRDTPIPDVGESARLLMRLCSYEHYRPCFLQVGMKGENTLALAIRLHLSEAHRMYGSLEQIRQAYAEAGL